MAWLTRALLLGLFAQLAISKTSNKDEPQPAPVPNAKDGKNLTNEQMDKSQVVYTSNTTFSDSNSIPPTNGWWSSNICSQQTYCIYTNLGLGHGRGIVLLTKYADFQNIARLDQHLDEAEDRIEAFTTRTTTPERAEATGAKGKEDRQREEEKPFSESFILSKGPGLTATIPLRRGKPLMSAAPALLVHKDFFADIWRKSERNKLLEKAVSFLPPATREAFDKQRTTLLSPDQKERTIEQILLASPFEIDLGSNSYTPLGQESLQANHSKHYINYPSMSLFTHSCRPNIAFHIDRTLALRTTVARKVAPGEELSIAYIDPLLPRKERQEWVGKYRPSSSSSPSPSPSPYCPCPSCTGHSPSLSKPHGNPHPSSPMSPSQELSTSSARLASLHRIRSLLRNHDSPAVPPETIEYFLKLHLEEGLESKMAEAYELAATNYNYLGQEDDKKAKKYAELAVQAARIEHGKDANEVVAMRIMAGDVRGHWSWGYKLCHCWC
ncbi:hypothetical protein NEUTE2DRAFT_128599 [Neurospora tetrasperma FGSC 2509]|nr:hypothetical protein NEUTE2DRAFT_128599 [Neurospora tetrasperma FGSC 2509]